VRKSTRFLAFGTGLAMVAYAALAISCSQPAPAAPAPTAKPAAPVVQPTTAAPVAQPATAAAAPAAPTKAAAPAQASSGPKITIKAASAGFPMPGGLDEQLNEQVIGYMTFEQQLKKYTDKVDLQVFHNSQLGDEGQTMQGARMGVPAPMASGATNNLHPFAPSVGFMTLPYMWDSYAQTGKVLNKVWDELDQRLIKEAGVRAIFYCPTGFRDITNSKKPIKTIDDLKGLKIRVPPNQIMVGTYKAWGVEPVAIAYSELYQALQQKVIDGHDLAAVTHYTGKFYETQKYYTPLKYLLLFEVSVMGEQFYQSLPKDVQEAVTKAGRDTLNLTLDQLGKKNEFCTNEMVTTQGLEKTLLTDEEKEWKARSVAIWKDYYDKCGGKDWVEKILAIKNAP